MSHRVRPQQKIQVLTLGSAQQHSCSGLVGGADNEQLSGLLGSDRPSATVKVGRTNLDERIRSWEEHLVKKGWDVERAVDLAERFYSVGGTTIDRIIDRAEAESGGSEPNDEVLWEAARECSRPEMQGLALHVTPRYRWDDLILPPRSKSSCKIWSTIWLNKRPSFTDGVPIRFGLVDTASKPCSVVVLERVKRWLQRSSPTHSDRHVPCRHLQRSL